MAADISRTWTDRRRPAEDEICPLQVKSLRTDKEISVYRQDSKSLTGSSCEEEEKKESMTSVSGCGRMGEGAVSMVIESSDDELGRLDIDLDRKSKRHNLTSCNVRAILHEVITHEHVVAMMKAAIRDTQDLPMFPPQFVDIDLEENEDSSDEEYCPDDEEEEEEDIVKEKSPGLPREQLMTSTFAPQHILTAPEPSFLDRLNAVEEELDCSPAYTYNQAEGRADEDCLAYRTRSRLPLVNVPLGRLEAKLLAPDITADMYDQSIGQREEDRHWTEWLQSLMALDSEGEGDDDEDDPEYNFLDDLDEPDLEDYRTDRAVQITSSFYFSTCFSEKEVNELLEELFDTLQEEEEVVPEEEEESPLKVGPKFNVPQALR
ncbi:GON-4-like protein GON-4 -like protein [Channa argus]|uniref:GON-4-like protein GON-4-like protein n=1 Tax=Channa argus TaxID=215402 RepID=A0A6G1PQL0_CHAAH|nr:GON-4-like protein GON-4 -like protein [Channa argus]